MKNVNPGHKCPRVMVDPGHYGNYNPGVIKGSYEAQVMWKLAKYLVAELETRGMDADMTRTDQAKDMDLIERGRKAKGCDLFASLHSNACDKESVDRVEAIYQWDDDCGVMDARSKEIAGLLTDTVHEVMKPKDKSRIFTRKAGRDRDGDGKANDDYYGVLEGAHQVGVPAVILEHSFHTNKRACKWLMDDANLRKLAKAEAETIAKWFDVAAPATPAPSTSVEAEEVVAVEKPNGTKNSADRGEYKVTCDNLALRNGAGTEPNSYGKDKTVLVRMNKGHKVYCYGYSRTVNGRKWLYVVATVKGVKYTGFVSSKYLQFVRKV